MSKPPETSQFEDVPPGLVYLFGELTQRVDGILENIKEIRHRSERFEEQTLSLIRTENREMREELERQVEIIHRRIEAARARSIQWGLLFATIMSALGAIGVLAIR